MAINYGDLSKDVFVEILSKLPVKSLLRIKSCCKFVYTLVKDPDFISTHIKNYNNDNIRLIVSYHTEEDLDLIQIPILYLDETLSDLSYRRMYPQVLKHEEILGCQDGLIFLFSYHDIKILNLATRESITLSIPRIKLPTNLFSINFHVGFGLDPISKDRKLVIISGLCDRNSERGSSDFSHVAIYNLNTNTWGEIGNEGGLINYKVGSQQTYLKGFCYFIMYRDKDEGNEDEGDRVIHEFDLNKEVFNEIEWPYCISKSKDMTMGLYNNCLSLITSEDDRHNSYRHKSYDIWAMNEGRWTKQATISLGVEVLRTTGFWKNGVCFRQHDPWGLLFYDPSTREVRDLCLDAYFIDIYTFSYKESLIALQGERIDIPRLILGEC